MVAVLIVGLLIAGPAAAKQIYLKDGGIIDCLSFRKVDSKVVVLINQESVIDLPVAEVDMKRTFEKKIVPRDAKGKTGTNTRSTAKSTIKHAPPAHASPLSTVAQAPAPNRANQAASAGGYWTVQGSTAMETLTFPNGKGATSFLLSYNTNNSCRPEVALLIFQDRSMQLGAFQKRKATKDIMTITIDGQKFSGYTNYSKYSNAIEAGFVANEQVVNRLQTGRTAYIKTTDKTPQIEFPLEGAANAIESARRNCR